MSPENVQALDEIGEARPTTDRSTRSVIGTWQLVSWEVHADGSVTLPFGDDPIGYLTYTADGYVFVQIMRPGPRTLRGQLQSRATPEEIMRALGFGAYGGTYELQDGVVVHHVEVSVFPDWPGEDRRRTLDWDGNRLVLTTLPSVGDRASRFSRLTWQRALSVESTQDNAAPRPSTRTALAPKHEPITRGTLC